MFKVTRSKTNPLISPERDHLWEELSTCNGCPIKSGRKYYCFYRAIADPDKMGNNKDLTISSIGRAECSDGENYGDKVHFLKPEHEWEKFGCEDPRITKFENKYYLFYTALSHYPLNAESIHCAVAVCDTVHAVTEKHLVTPFNAKAMALFPERINGKIAVILTANTDRPPAEIAVRLFDNIEDLWNQEKWHEWYENLKTYSIPLRRGQNDHVEVGAPPIKTKDGWLLIYSHIQNYFSADKVFGIEAVLLDLEDPRIVIGRTTHPMAIPEEIYERYGYIPTIIFPSGALVENGMIEVYYGASDSTTCKFSVRLSDLVNSILPKKRMAHVTRGRDNPHLLPIPEHKWEERSVFNPAVIDVDGVARILYRAMSFDGTSYVGYAESVDGEVISYRSPEPAYTPKEDFEIKKGDPRGNSGCEDPRLTMIDDRIYMCYTGYDGVKPPRVAVTSISKTDFVNKKWNWKKSVAITPEGIDDKDACLFPEKINGKYLFIHRIAHTICMDYLPDLEFKSGEVDTCVNVMEPRPGMWDGAKIGLSCPPHKTEKGWLMFYHGIDSNKVYRMGAVLLDLDDPTNVIGRTADPIFEPEEVYEKNGEIPNVVFPCGSIIRDDMIYIYYGGADTVAGVVKIPLKKILAALS